MQIDYALILCAGFGSRMGEIGKKIPKPLWPIYSKKLIELQFDYCKELGVKKIYLNTHFLSDKIINFLKTNEKFRDVIVLHEDPILDSGGAIHNLAAQKEVGYKGNVLLVNADQFLFFDKRLYEDALKLLSKKRAALFGILVDKNSKYNETIIEDMNLVDIRKPTSEHDYVTYSGLGLLRLDDLTPVVGPSRFFETVADFKKEEIGFLSPEKFEYWDFGTADVYLKNIGRIHQYQISKKDSSFIEFLKRNGTFNEDSESFF